MKTTAITLTGNRTQAFELCQRWMSAQTRKVDQWIVVNDGQTEDRPQILCDYIRRTPKTIDPAITMILNLKEALPKVTGDYIFFWEDDEYYHPTYIEEMTKRLDKYEAVGIGNSKYYHLGGAYHIHKNINHASLAQTAFRKSQIKTLESCLSGNSFIDEPFWAKVFNKGIIFDDRNNPLYVGIKGLPGRPGIGMGHDLSWYELQDKDRSILKKWIPKDYQVYLDLLKQTPIQKLNTRRYEMGMYKAKTRGLVGRRLVEPGEIFSWDGPKGSWMESLDGPKETSVIEPETNKDIFMAAAELAKRPASVLNQINSPIAAPALPTEPAKMGRPKVKK